MSSLLNPLERDQVALKEIESKIYKSGHFKQDLLLNLAISNIAVFRCVIDKINNSLKFSMPIYKQMGISEKSYSCYVKGEGEYKPEALSTFSLHLHSDLFDSDFVFCTDLLNPALSCSGDSFSMQHERFVSVRNNNILRSKLIAVIRKLKDNVYRLDFNFLCKDREYDIIKAYTSIPDVVLNEEDIRLIARILKRRFDALNLKGFSLINVEQSYKQYMDILDMMET